MSDAVPPQGTGPLARREARLAWSMLSPTIFAVALVVIIPLIAIFWISADNGLVADRYRISAAEYDPRTGRDDPEIGA